MTTDNREKDGLWNKGRVPDDLKRSGYGTLTPPRYPVRPARISSGAVGARADTIAIKACANNKRMIYHHFGRRRRCSRGAGTGPYRHPSGRNCSLGFEHLPRARCRSGSGFT